MTLRWTQTPSVPFWLQTSQAFIYTSFRANSEIWLVGYTHPVFLPFLILYQSGEVLRLKTQMGFYVFLCLVLSILLYTQWASSINTNWDDFKQKPELGGSEPAPDETPCSSPSSSYGLNEVTRGTTIFPTASRGPIQPNSTFLCCIIPRKKGKDGMGFIWDISCIRYCIGSQTLRSLTLWLRLLLRLLPD